MKRVLKESCGIDGMNFEIKLNCNINNFREQELKNADGLVYGKIQRCKTGIELYLNLPCYFNKDNRKPFSLVDAIKLEIVKNDVSNKIARLIGEKAKGELTSLEINITNEVGEDVDISALINLISNSLLFNVNGIKCSKYFCNKKLSNDVNIQPDGAICIKKHYYVVKVYNKTKQLFEEKRIMVKSKLFRIEIILLDRELKKLFGEKLTVANILNKSALSKAVNRYKEIFNDVIIVSLEKYLDRCVNQLVADFTTTDKISSSIIRQKEIIFDVEILRKALKRYYRTFNHDMKESTKKNMISYYCNNNKCDLPVKTLQTLKEFHDITN